MRPLIMRSGRNGVLDGQTLDDIKRIARQIVEAPQSVLHIHGGLVSAAAGIEAASRLTQTYESAGITALFPIWETGALEEIQHHASEIFEERIFQRLLKFLLKYAGGLLDHSDGARAPGGLRPLSDREVELALSQARLAKTDPQSVPEPLSDISSNDNPREISPAEVAQFQNALNESQELHAEYDGLILGLGEPPPPGARGGAMPPPQPSLISEAVKQELRASARAPGARGLFSMAALVRHAVAALYRVIKRFATQRDHGLYTTCVEELCRELYIDQAGALLWGWIKSDAAEAFNPVENELRGGLLLVAELAHLIQSRNEAGLAAPKISIVAHSAGSIWTASLFRAIAASQNDGRFPKDFSFHKVIFLAPACTYPVFGELIQHSDTRRLFPDFRMFALGDSIEHGYWEAPPLYARSLLYMVSGMFETQEADMPLLGMQRFLTNDTVFKTEMDRLVQAYLSSPGHSVYSIVDGGNGLSCDSRKHGAFTNTADPLPSTMASVLYLLR